ncbi:MAG: DUF748 domain-containing protein [Bacteroidales bacterium]|nr:DUF748 domain-containing protein [Bacteroidales bacterium]
MKKILLIVAISIAVIIAIVAFAVSPIAKHFLINNSKELIGRKIDMENLSVNIFTGRLQVENFTLYEADDSTSFVAFDLFDVNVNLHKLLSKTAEIESVELSGADIRVIQNGNIFNFTDIIEFFYSDSTATDTVEEPSEWNVVINDIHLNHSYLYYQDQEIGSEWKLKDISLVIPGIDLSDLSTDMGLQLDFTNGGKLETTMKYNTEKALYVLQVKIQNFHLSPVLPYLQQSLNIENLDGKFSADLAIHGSSEHILNFDVTGLVSLSEFNMLDTLQKSAASFDSVATTIKQIDLINNKIELSSLYISGLHSYYEIFQDKNDNFSMLIKADTTQTQDSLAVAYADTTEEKPFVLIINDLRIANTNFDFIDNSLPQPFNYTISDICVSSTNFNITKQNTIEANAVLQNSGKLKLKWIGSIEDISNQNISVFLNNIDLQSFTPYSLAMFGNPITNGHISIQSQNVIINNRLKGTNKVSIFQPQIGDKDKSVKAEYNVPLKMGLYILTDKNGKVDLDLPISGNIDSPDFSYGKIIIKTLGNLLVKVAASPFNVLKNSNAQIDQVCFNATATEFSNEEYAQFAQLGTMLREKPELKLHLTQNLLYRDAVTEYSINELKKNMAIQDSTNHITEDNANELLIKEKYLAIPTKSEELRMFADKMLRERNITLQAKLTTEQKAVLIYENTVKQSITNDMQWRNSLVQNYLKTSCSVPDSSFKILSNIIENDTVKTFKNNYSVEWSL